jgi:intracellular multiplication protein IcmO
MDATLLGLNAEKFFNEYVYIKDSDRNKHMAITGQTGCGKTTIIINMIYQDCLKNDRSIVIIDPKGEVETFEKIYAVAKMAGREADILHFSLTNRQLSHTYNPLLLGKGIDPDVVIEAFIGNYYSDNTYYLDVARSIFPLVYKILNSSGMPFTAMDIYSYLENPEVFEIVNKELYTKFPDSISYLSTLDSEVRRLNAQHKEFRLALIGFFNYLLKFDIPQMGEADSDIDLVDCVMNKKIIYFSLPTNAHTARAKLIAKMLQANLRYISAMIQTGMLSSKTLVSVFIDEFGSVADADFIEAINKARSSGMMITLCMQTMKDLAAVSEDFKQRIEESTLTKIHMKQNSPEECEHIASSVGTKLGFKMTRREKLGDFGNKILTGESSYRDTFEYVLHPDKIKRLHSYGQGYLISRLTNEIKCVNFSGLGIKGSNGFIKKERESKMPGLNVSKRFNLLGLDKGGRV